MYNILKFKVLIVSFYDYLHPYIQNIQNFYEDKILSVHVEPSGCEGGAKPVKINSLEPHPVSSSSLKVKLSVRFKVQGMV